MPVTFWRDKWGKRLTACGASRSHSPPLLPKPSIHPMGQQSNKVQKRRRRIAYLERKKAKAKVTAASKPAKKKAAPKKAAAPAAEAAATE